MSLLREELAARPEDPLVHYEIGWTHDALGKESDAAPAYEHAIRLGLRGEEPEGAYLSLGSTYRTLGQYERAHSTLARGLQLFPESRAMEVFLALGAYNLGRHAESMEILIRHLLETSDDAGIQSYRKALLFYRDKLDQTFE